MGIAGLLEEKASIPMVREQLALIQDIQTDEWWQDVTTPMLESVRRRLRGLVKLIEKAQRKIVYTDFADEMGEGREVELPGISAGEGFEKFLSKARAFLREHQDHIAIHKLRLNKALTGTDLEELEKMLQASGVGGAEQIERAIKESQGLGIFVRSLVGLDREAAKAALAEFTAGKPMAANQIEFVNLVVNHLTENGIMEAFRLYESPFTDIVPQGPETIFSPNQIDKLVSALERVKAAARAA
jgi:type I restriction enzyme R subunit